MNRFFAPAIVGLLLSPICAFAQSGEYENIGYGRLVNNDFIGDMKDRGQTGSIATSRIFGDDWNGSLPNRPFEILEFRLGADIKAPDNLVSPAAGDRPFAGTMSLGLHTHYQQAGYEIALGGDISATGPQTGLDVLQTMLHDGLGIAPPSSAARAGQIANQFHASAVVEMGRPFRLGSNTEVRPFVEGRIGLETLVRTGFDITIGAVGQSSAGEMMVREGITGQRYRTIQRAGKGISFTLGADMAMVSESIYLPASSGISLTDRRDRVRSGIHWQGEKNHGFLGLTYLGKEFSTQKSSQVVGSIRLALKF